MASYATSPVRRSILIVEDEAMIALMLEEFVDTLGHHVQAVAGTVDDACAMLDCHLDGEPVWPVADMLEASGIPYILSSGGSVSEIPAPYAARPMLAKPYTIGTISDMLAASESARA
jgi:CheY-like chemotaxis protein